MTSLQASTRQQYRFAEHGATGYSCACSCGDYSSPRERPALTLASIINRENLVCTFKRVRNRAGQAPGIDGYRYPDFSISEIGAIADDIVAAIRAGHWQPSRSRRRGIPKPPRGRRQLDIRCVKDRLVSAAVSYPVMWALEPIFLPMSFAYRPGRCVHGLLAILAHHVEAGYPVIAQDDVERAFDFVRIDDVMHDYESVIHDPGLVRLVEVILRGYQQSQIGIEQGDPLSPPSFNLRLHTCLDLPSTATTGPDSPLRYRYSDNVVYQCRSVSEGQRAIESDGALLRQAGFRFKGQGNYPVDLRRLGSSVSVLGFRIRLEAGSVKFDVGNKAFQKLSIALNRAHEFPDSTEVANLIVTAWIEEYGPAFESYGAQPFLRKVLEALWACGFHEVGSMRRLSACADRAVAHWRDAKQASLRQFLPLDQLLRAPQRSSCP